MAHDRSQAVLKTPAGDNRIVTGDEEARKDSKVTHPLPGCSVGQLRVGTCGVRGCVAADDELADHARQAQKQDTTDINQDEGRTAILPCHIGETPHVAQTDSTACRGKNHSQFTSELCSFLLDHVNLL